MLGSVLLSAYTHRCVHAASAHASPDKNRTTVLLRCVPACARAFTRPTNQPHVCRTRLVDILSKLKRVGKNGGFGGFVFPREGRAGLAPRRCEVVCLLGDMLVWSLPQHGLSARKRKENAATIRHPNQPVHA